VKDGEPQVLPPGRGPGVGGHAGVEQEHHHHQLDRALLPPTPRQAGPQVVIARNTEPVDCLTIAAVDRLIGSSLLDCPIHSTVLKQLTDLHRR
jgi:hypothetical protein